MQLLQWLLAVVRLGPPASTSPTTQPSGPATSPFGIGAGKPSLDICDSLPYHHYNDPTPKLRTSFSASNGYVHARAHPSLGGIVTATLSAVQLKQLGLSNLKEVPRSYNSTEEDEVALALLRHGGHWWCSYSHYHHRHRQLRDRYIPYDFHFPSDIHVAYPPSGDGVWVSKFSIDGRVDINDYSPEMKTLEPKPADWNRRVSMALTPDDRVEILKSFGATFYDIVEDCKDIPRTLKEGQERGKRYEALLRKMDDKGYRDEWLNKWPLHDLDWDI